MFDAGYSEVDCGGVELQNDEKIFFINDSFSL